MVDGRSLGCVIDLVMEDCSGVVLGFLVPSLNNGFFNLFHSEQIFIPWQNICKIGEDVILVELVECYNCVDSCSVQNLDEKAPPKDPKNYFQDYSRKKPKMEAKLKNKYQKVQEFKVYDAR
jgi:YlmC/YmxH family sporulation protein